MGNVYGKTGKEHMEPSEPGEENTAGRDPYDTDIIYKQHIYLSPGCLLYTSDAADE